MEKFPHFELQQPLCVGNNETQKIGHVALDTEECPPKGDFGMYKVSCALNLVIRSTTDACCRRVMSVVFAADTNTNTGLGLVLLPSKEAIWSPYKRNRPQNQQVFAFDFFSVTWLTDSSGKSLCHDP